MGRKHLNNNMKQSVLKCSNECNRLNKCCWRVLGERESAGTLRGGGRVTHSFPKPGVGGYLNSQPLDANLYLWEGISISPHSGYDAFDRASSSLFSSSLPSFFMHLVLVQEVKSLGSRTAPSQNSSYPVSVIAALQPVQQQSCSPEAGKRRLPGSGACWSSLDLWKWVAWRWARYSPHRVCKSQAFLRLIDLSVLFVVAFL